MMPNQNTNTDKTHQNYKYLLFDLDNTLFNYNQAEDMALCLTFRDFQCTEDMTKLKHVYTRINAGYWRAFEEKRIKLDDLKKARFRDLFLEISSLHHLDANECSEKYLDHLSEQIQLLPGARELLETLHGRYQMCLVTNGIARVQHRRISKSGFEKFFCKVIISEEIGYSKPEPAFFHHTLFQLGNPVPGEVLVIGDNLHSDIFGALNFGLDACWYNPQNQEEESEISPTFIISELSDLINILTL